MQAVAQGRVWSGRAAIQVCINDTGGCVGQAVAHGRVWSGRAAIQVCSNTVPKLSSGVTYPVGNGDFDAPSGMSEFSSL